VQAYAATYMRQPELAQKNPRRITLGATGGGGFGCVFSAEVSVEKVVLVLPLAWLVDEHIRQFITRKPRRERTAQLHAFGGGPVRTPRLGA
jgi:hypothetical protein